MTTGREITIKTPLGEDVLLFSQMTGHDQISSCFDFDLEMVSEDIDIAAPDLLGQAIEIKIGSEDEEPVFLHGLVDELRLSEINGQWVRYHARLRPWLWFLSKSTDNRIFQNMSVVEIIEEIFGEYPAAKYEIRLQGSYQPIPYCVQYGESDLDFLMRWMEHEGIFTFFEFAEGMHTLVLVDTLSGLATVPGNEEVPFAPDLPPTFDNRDFITRWAWQAAVTTGEFTHTDYDFTKPAADLVAKSANSGEHDLGDLERYHYPGKYTELDRGDALAAVRMEELKSPVGRATARATVRGLHSGVLFTLTEFPREAENAEYAVLRTQYRMWDGQYTAQTQEIEEGFEVDLYLSPTTEEYRPPRVTPKPVMRGPQTAVVVGPSGEEIFTDEYARVKVQFHWDRQGASDENSSCFVRVSSVWAGSGYGFIQIPRIGQEVIVDFLEGDPDQPIITGRVYNAAQMPPYGLPGNATQSGWKSDSSLGGGGFNELRFEDKAGSEEVYFQAQKDHNELVKNDEGRVIGHDFKEEIGNDSYQSVGNDAEQHIGHDRTETVANDKATAIGANRQVQIGENDAEQVGANRSLHVGGNEEITIDGDSDEKIWKGHSQYVLIDQKVTVGGLRSDKVGGVESRAVGGWQSTTVAGYRAVTVGGYQKHAVSGNDTTQINGSQTLQLKGNQEEKIGGDQSFWVEGEGTYMVTGKCFHSAEEDAAFRSNKNLLLEAADSKITIKCGNAMIVLQKDGTIGIEGKDISLDASGKINIKAGGEISLKGSKINQN
ncbi:type VI secretion system Vgr family protein [Yoonia sediminilitoris]|uniref:Type VI secretion system secreted protein VgrG n=1 Tax=Yoonia sediminilitoris TaxID=1286148 RepID=A0A2T6KM38_9RHOB|nr:type VI secretion system tip protein VgrG [Yoonia sediminilitoris]PUB17282.1 type VI secretion system secreted protein VgrG [Yoonia sediminilitoris]RCW97577.1 type VI secretion system secreted protein VgrG [Yoonia sediminilitoris]